MRLDAHHGSSRGKTCPGYLCVSKENKFREKITRYLCGNLRCTACIMDVLEKFLLRHRQSFSSVVELADDDLK